MMILPALNEVLPRELIQDIFSRLEIEFVAVSRCVCKSWRDSLTEPAFVKTLHMRQPCKILVRTGPNFRSVQIKEDGEYLTRDLECPLRVHNDSEIYRICISSIIGSCNGLVCLDIKIFNKNLPNREGLALWNLATKEYNIILSPKDLYGYYIEFQAFGYDSESDDYKILQIIKNPPISIQEAHVYSLRSKSWKLLPNAPSILRIYPKSYCALDGNIYFTMQPDRENRRKDTMIVFSLKDDSFLQVPLPDNHSSDSRVFMRLKDIGGRVAIFQDYYQSELESPQQKHCMVELWTLKGEINGSQYCDYKWIKEMSISSLAYAIGGETPIHIDYMEPMFYLRNGKVVVKIKRIMQRETRFLLFDPNRKNSRLDDLPRISCPRDFPLSYGSVTYTESLVSPLFI